MGQPRGEWFVGGSVVRSATSTRCTTRQTFDAAASTRLLGKAGDGQAKTALTLVECPQTADDGARC